MMNKADPNTDPQTRTVTDTRTVAEAGSTPTVGGGLPDDAAGPLSAAGAPFLPPEIRDHTLLRRVGQGSYGEVWLARNVMGTFRAVKIVYRNAFDHARPFDREFNGIQKFEPLSRSHDGFVDILQVGRTDACFYYVMELADDVATGTQIDPDHYEPKTLRTEIASHKRLPFEQCVQLGLSLAHALGHLHSHGLIHRDIKPSNIIFVNGIPKLADIGLVADLNEARSFVGTEGFIPPEGPGTAQADIYSLGKVLYEIATGKDRHEFPTLPTLLDPAPGGAGTDTERGFIELNAVILKACRTELKERYATCEQLRDDLLLLQSGKSVQRGQALQRRVATLTRLSVAGTALTLLVIAGLIFFQRQATREAALRQRAEQGERAARESQREAQQNLYAADMLVAQQAVAEGNIGFARQLLLQHQGSETPGANPPGWEWRHLWHATRSQDLGTIGTHSNGVTAVAIAPDGRTVFSASKDGTISKWDAQERRRLAHWPQPGHVYDMVLSPDGTLLAAQCDNRGLSLMNSASGEVLMTVSNVFRVKKLRFNRQGDKLAWREFTRAGILDVPSGRLIQEFPTPDSEFVMFRAGIDLSPDGRWCAFGEGFKGLRVVDMATREERLLPRVGECTDVIFTADSSRLIASGMSGIKVWDTRDFKLVATNQASSGWEMSLTLSPDGKWLFSAGLDQLIRIRDTRNWNVVATLQGHTFEVWSLAFPPDWSWFASGSKDETVRKWAMPDLLEHPIDAISGDFVSGAITLDGSWLFTSDRQGNFSRSNCEGRNAAIDERSPIFRFPNIRTIETSSNWVVWFKEGRVRASHLYTTNVVDLPTPINPWSKMAFGPDPDLMALRIDYEKPYLELWNLKTRTRRPLDLGEAAGTALAFSGDGSLLAVATAYKAVKVVELDTGKVQTVVPGHKDHQLTSLAFSPDSRILASASYDATLRLTAWPSQRLIAELGGQNNSFTCLLFSPDGDRLFAGGGDGKLWIWDMTRKPIRLVGAIPVSAKRLSHLQMVANSDTLAAFSFDGLRFLQAPSP